MPPPPTAVVTYKKKDGRLSVSDHVKHLFWTPATPPNALPSVTILVADITNLQQTPESSSKVALKVFVQQDNHVFNFTSSNARKEQESITDALRNTIAANKSGSSAELVPELSNFASRGAAGQQDGGQGAKPAAMTISTAASSKTSAVDESWYDDAKLKSDFQLQRSLLDSNEALKARFNQALQERPESVTISQFTTQFWSARLHLLRAHAIEKAQKQGEYNVLPEIKYVRKQAQREGDPDIKQLNITKEQIKLIFKQYPVVSEAYNENVPKPLDASQFWQRFFGSRLLKMLKGERITQQDLQDPILDKYLDRPERTPASLIQVPHFIDLEGNEQDHSQRKGNRPDQDMRPSSYAKVPILRVLNNLSEKMLSHVQPEDIGEAHAPIGMDEETYEQLRLKDLAREEGDHRVVLNVREQQRYIGGSNGEDLSKEAEIYAQQEPRDVLNRLRSDLVPANLGSDETGSLRLDRAIGYDPDSDDDSGDEEHPPNNRTTAMKGTQGRVGSRTAISEATASLLQSISRNRTATSTSADSLRGLTQTTFDQLAITHNTTIEFLHYFWTLFLSGDSSRSNELAQLVSTLDRSIDRINAVAQTAEKEREAKINGLKEQVQEYYRRTKKRRKVDYESVDGGKREVESMIAPTVGALRKATEAYRRAFEEQMKETEAQ